MLTSSRLKIAYPLRDYQKIWIQDIFFSWSRGKTRILAQMACGGGKTVCFAHISNHFLEKGQRVLAIAHRIELIDQAAQKFREISGLDVGIIKGKRNFCLDAPIQVASIQTLSQRKQLPENVGLVIFDEAHHCSASTYRDIIYHYSKARVLGVTATPMRLDGQGFEDLFDDLVVGYPTDRLIKEGYLSKFRLFATDQTIDTYAVSSSTNDFNSRDLALAVTSQLSTEDIYKIYYQYAHPKSTIIYAASIAHSKSIAEYFQSLSIAAEHIDGDTSPSERLRILQRFQSGETKILTNYEILMEGYDYQDIECVFCIRPTESPTLWLQMTGRVLRAGKSSLATIIDVTDNWKKHGLPDDARLWSLTAVSMPTKFRCVVKCSSCTHIFKPLSSELASQFYASINELGLLVKHHQATCPNCGELVEFTTVEDEKNHERISVRLKPGIIPEVIEIDLQVNSDLVTEVYWFVKSLYKQRLSVDDTYKEIFKHFIKKIEFFTLGDWRQIVKIVEPSVTVPTKKAWSLYQEGILKYKNRLAAISSIEQRQQRDVAKQESIKKQLSTPSKTNNVVQVVKQPVTVGNPQVKKKYQREWMLALSRCIESSRNFLDNHGGLFHVEDNGDVVNISIELENVPDLKARLKTIGEIELNEAFSASFGKKASVMFRLTAR